MDLLRTDALTHYETLRSLVEKNLAIHPIAILNLPNKQQVMIIVEFRSGEEEVKAMAELKMAIEFYKVDTVFWLTTCNSILPANGPGSTLFYSVIVYERNHSETKEASWVYGEPYQVVDNKVVWNDSLCSDEHVISTNVLGLFA